MRRRGVVVAAACSVWNHRGIGLDGLAGVGGVSCGVVASRGGELLPGACVGCLIECRDGSIEPFVLGGDRNRGVHSGDHAVGSGDVPRLARTRWCPAKWIFGSRSQIGRRCLPISGTRTRLRNIGLDQALGESAG